MPTQDSLRFRFESSKKRGNWLIHSKVAVEVVLLRFFSTESAVVGKASRCRSSEQWHGRWDAKEIELDLDVRHFARTSLALTSFEHSTPAFTVVEGDPAASAPKTLQMVK